jgi:transcriptional regulator with XRE-family HTH domain
MNQMNTLGSLIRERREALKYTQNDLSELSGVAERTIRSIEGGQNSNMANMTKILQVLGLELTVKIKTTQHGD